MARWTRDEVLNQPADFVQFMMEDFLTKNGFRKKTHKGQEVWQEGDGFLTMARFIRYEYNDGSFHLEAWIGKKRENPIKGFVGAMPKKMFRESLEELIRLLHQPLPQGQEETGNKVITIQVPDHGKCAVPAMILSILGIVVGLLLSPLGGIVLGTLDALLAVYLVKRLEDRADAKTVSDNDKTIAMVAAIIGYVINLIFAFTFIF